MRGNIQTAGNQQLLNPYRRDKVGIPTRGGRSSRFVRNSGEEAGSILGHLMMSMMPGRDRKR